MGNSNSTVVVDNCNYLIATLSIDIHVKEALLESCRDTSFVKVSLPADGVDLFNFFTEPKRKRKLDSLLKQNSIYQDQYDLLLPQNCLTESKNWDVTIIARVAGEFLFLPNSSKAIIKDAQKSRNGIKHGNPEEFKQQQKFNDTMDDIKKLLIELNYAKMNDFHNLRNNTLQIDLNTLMNFHKTLMTNVTNDILKQVTDSFNVKRERQNLESKEIRLERNLHKDVQITLNFKNLNIANITAIDVGKEIDEKIEIVYKGLQQNEYLITPLHDIQLVQIFKEMESGFVHSIKMKTLQTDGTNEEFVVNVKGRDVWKILREKNFKKFEEIFQQNPNIVNSLRDGGFRGGGFGGGSTLLMKAVYEDRFDVFVHLMEYPHDFSLVDKHGWNVLHWVASRGSVRHLEMFDRQTIKMLIDGRTKHNYTPLHFAALNNKHDVIRRLLAKGADHELKDDNGQRPDEQSECDGVTKEIFRSFRSS
uniref:Uncharacterized protein n=1 Tax=Clytia hemisphaerica TaxID=252671 RepID=A0A7M5X5Q9_9CNID